MSNKYWVCCGSTDYPHPAKPCLDVSFRHWGTAGEHSVWQNTKPTIDTTLAERDSTYGSFTGQSEITQTLKETLHGSKNWGLLADDMKEALEMIASKIARILNGDPTYVDSWHDIVGYARLIEKRLTKETV